MRAMPNNPKVTGQLQLKGNPRSPKAGQDNGGYSVANDRRTQHQSG